MTKKSFSVKSVLMSIATAVTFCFVSCTDDMMETSTNNNGQIPEGAETALLEPYGLTFQNFVTDNDVQILNSDTTEISVSKELAKKLGITSFVNHPLGIWQAEAQLPYARLALAEKEVGDHYILTVRPASVAEVVGNKKVTLNTDIYVDKTAKGGQTRAGGIVMPEYAAKYIDSEDVIHPAYIHLTDAFGYDNGYHTDADKPVATRGANSGEYQFVTAEELAERQTRASARCSIISFHDKLEFDHNLGSDDNDNKADDESIIETSDASANVNFTSELDFDLNYFITLDGDVHWTPFPVPYVEKFETGLDGSIDLNSQLTFGFKKAWQIKKNKLKWKLCSFNAYTFTFWVGPVPVCVQCEPELYLKVDGGVSGEARVGVKYEYASNFKGGVRYEDGKGWSAIKEFNELKNSAELIKPEATVHAEAGFGLYLGMNVMIYGVAGPTASVGPRIGGSADFTFSPFADKPEDKLKLEAELKLTVNATAGAKLKVLGYELAEYTKTFELAGPWTLVKYPSDGTEHVVGSENPIDQSWYTYLAAVKNYSSFWRADIDKALNMLKETYGYNDEQAVHALLAYVATPGETAPRQDPDIMSMFMSHVEYIFNEEIQPRYDDFQYQKHAAAGDTKWINEFNWRKICDSMKSNLRWDSLTPVDQGLEEIHQWFLDDFNREPSMASADDMKWLERVYSQYAYEKDKRVQKQIEDVYKALQDKYADKYAQDATTFMAAAKQAHLDFFLQYDFYPGVNDPRMEQLFLTAWEKIQNDIKQREQEAQEKKKQKEQEEQAAAANWAEVLSVLQSMNAADFQKYPRQSTKSANSARKSFVEKYHREPTTSPEDIAILNASFLSIMEYHRG